MRYYRSIQIITAALFIILLGLGIILPLVVFKSWKPNTLAVIILSLIIWGAAAYFLDKKGTQIFERCTSRFYQNCDPVTYYNQMKKRYKPTFLKQDEYRVTVNTAVALVNMNKADNALMMLKQAEAVELPQKYDSLKIDYYDIMTYACILKGDYKKAEHCLDEMKAFIALSKKSLATREGWQKKYLVRKSQYALYSGQTANVESFFNTMLAMSVCEYDKVFFNYMLGRTLLKKNREADSLEALRYVIRNGNKLYIKSEAQEMAINMTNKTPAAVTAAEQDI